MDDTYVDPRINVSYDVKGDGALLLNANWGQYHAMLNQAWISGGDVARPSLHDLWNGYEGREVFLFCDPHDVAGLDGLRAVGYISYDCRHPSRRDTIRNGTVGDQTPGYNLSWELAQPGLMWDAVAAGIFDYDIQTYYKQEAILGLEWQLRPNWALDVKYIDWQMQDMMFSNFQLDQRGRPIGITENYHDLEKIVLAFDDLRAQRWADAGFDEADRPSAVNREALANADPAKNSYRGLQIQLNRRFADGWALYNNLAWSETDTTGGGGLVEQHGQRVSGTGPREPHRGPCRAVPDRSDRSGPTDRADPYLPGRLLRPPDRIHRTAGEHDQPAWRKPRQRPNLDLQLVRLQDLAPRQP